MTTQEAKQVLDWIAEGKCEYKYAGIFKPYPNYSCRDWLMSGNEDFSDYRRATEPKLRPWKPEEVPVGALIAWKRRYDEKSLIIGVCHTGVQHVGYNAVHVQPFKDCLESAEHSTDGGKTWHPCGVQE